MPISAEQWKMSIGLLYTPIPVISRNTVRCGPWSVVWNMLTSPLLFAMALWTGDRELETRQCHTGPTNNSGLESTLHTVTSSRSIRGSKSEGKSFMLITTFLLMVVATLLFLSGNVERNPGPVDLSIDDLAHVSEHLHKARNMWYHLGIELKVDPMTLQGIRDDRIDNYGKLREVLTVWLKQVSPKPSWSILVHALRTPIVGFGQLANEIEEFVPSHPVGESNDSLGAVVGNGEEYSAAYDTLATKEGHLTVCNDLVYVRRYVWEEKCINWYDLGIELKLDIAALEVIKRDIGKTEDCLTEMLIRWLNRPQPLLANLKDAVDALKIGHGQPLVACETIPVSESESSGASECPAKTGQPLSIHDQVEGFEVKFDNLERRAFDCVDRKFKDDGSLTIDRFRVSILPNHTAAKHHCISFYEKRLKKCKRLDDLWEKLKIYWNFLNYTLLKQMIEVYGDDDLKRDMSTYVEELKEFRRTTLVWEFLSEHTCGKFKERQKLLTKFSKFTNKHEKMEYETCTLEDMESVRSLITHKFLLPKYALLFKELKSGCVLITWLVPDPIAKPLREDIDNEDSKEFFREHHIKDSKVDESVVAYLQKRYMSEISKLENLAKFRLAQIENMRLERQRMNQFERSSIRFDIDDVKFRKSSLSEIELDDKLSSCQPDASPVKPRLVLIDGAPGVGKTTFSKEYCRKWAHDEALQEFSLLVFLPLRDARVKSAKSISDLFYEYEPTLREQVADEVSESKGKGIAFWLEGWDELDNDLRTKSSIFLELIHGPSLPKATVFVTSRPWASQVLAEKVVKESDMHIEILTSSEIQIARVKEKLGHPNSEKFVDYISRNVAIKAVMYTHLAADIVEEVFQWSLDTDLLPPTTLTQLYTLYVYQQLPHTPAATEQPSWDASCYDDLPDDIHKHFLSLSKVAFDGISNRQLIFRDLPLEMVSLGLMKKTEQPSYEPDQPPVYSYHFIHLTVQEYLAAFHISQLETTEQIEHVQKFREHNSELYGHFKMPLRFLAGLTCLKYLTENLSSQLLRNDKLTLFHWLFEAGDAETIGTVLSKEKMTVVHVDSSYSWSPLDFYVTGYCLSFSNCDWSLEFSQFVGDGELEMFYSAIISNPEAQYSSYTVSRLSFKSVTLTMDNIFLMARFPSRFWKGLKTLLLRYCKLPRDKAPLNILASVIPSMESLEEVDILSHIGSGGAVGLLHALCGSKTLRHLDLSDTKIGEEDCEAVGELLASSNLTSFYTTQLPSSDSVLFVVRNCSRLKNLKLTASLFTPNAMNALSKTLRDPACVLEYLELFECGIDIPQTIELSRALTENHSLKHLNLSYNRLMGGKTADSERGSSLPAMKAIADMLSRNECIEMLDMSTCRFTPKEIVLLAEVLTNKNSTLKTLNISQNNIAFDGAKALAQMIKENKTLEVLHLSSVPALDVTKEGCQMILDALKASATITWIGLPIKYKKAFKKVYKDSRIYWSG